MEIVSPLSVGLFPFQMAEFHGLYMGGDPNHLLNGMILQAWHDDGATRQRCSPVPTASCRKALRPVRNAPASRSATLGDIDTGWNEWKATFWAHGWVVVSNIFYFHPYFGKIPNLTHIFQRGWNHQLENLCRYNNPGSSKGCWIDDHHPEASKNTLWKMQEKNDWVVIIIFWGDGDDISFLEKF